MGSARVMREYMGDGVAQRNEWTLRHDNSLLALAALDAAFVREFRGDHANFELGFGGCPCCLASINFRRGCSADEDEAKRRDCGQAKVR